MNSVLATADQFPGVPHRYRRIIEGKNELERLICGRADIFCPSSLKHPLRGDITGRTDLIVDSKKRKNKIGVIKSMTN